MIDTNVLVSAMLKKSSLPDRVMQEIFGGTITPLDVVFYVSGFHHISLHSTSI